MRWIGTGEKRPKIMLFQRREWLGQRDLKGVCVARREQRNDIEESKS